MTLPAIPTLHPKFACITTQSSPTLSAVVSSFFNETAVYFPVFTFPDIDSPYSETAPFSDDFYIGRAMGLNAAIVINNAIVALGSTRVILAGLSEIQKGYICALLPKEMLVEVDSIEGIENALASFSDTISGVFPCRESDIIPALLAAKKQKQRLYIDEAAPPIATPMTSNVKSLVVIELTGKACDVIATNYAYSIDSDVRFVPSIEREQMRAVHKRLYAWKTAGSEHEHKNLKLSIRKRVKGINFLAYSFATFFTRGLPYGLILKNIVPCTHIMTTLRSDLLIVNSILYESRESCGSAVVFSPKKFSYEETESVIAELIGYNYTVKSLISENATLTNLDDFGGYYPYDLLHVCSHGGETDGYYVIESFTDRNGAKHKLEYEEVVGYSPVDKETVRVIRKIIFRRLDGLRWQSSELKRKNVPRYVYEDLRKSVFHDHDQNKELIRVRAKYPIYASCHIKCYDSIHQGDFRVLAAHGAPFIFNNTCSSWYEIATLFLAAGARAYVGTLWNIGNVTAGQAAKVFYKELFGGGNLLDACVAMNASIANQQYRDIYMFWGLHFSSIKPSGSQMGAKQRTFNALYKSFLSWLHKYRTTKDAEVRRNCVPILRFIYREINEGFTPDHLQALQNEVQGDIEDYVRGLPEDEDSTTERGVIDIPEPVIN